MVIFYDNINDVQNRQAITIFFSAIVLAVILLITVHADRVRTIKEEGNPPAEVAVEHEAPATLTIHQTTGKNPGIVEFTGDGGDVRISVPSGWERREVRGAALSAVTSDPPSLGFTRWHLPEGVTLSLRTGESPSLTIRNASAPPLLVVGKRVDVENGKTEEKSILIKEQAARLW